MKYILNKEGINLIEILEKLERDNKTISENMLQEEITFFHYL